MNNNYIKTVIDRNPQAWEKMYKDTQEAIMLEKLYRSDDLCPACLQRHVLAIYKAICDNNLYLVRDKEMYGRAADLELMEEIVNARSKASSGTQRKDKHHH